jgi:hypothetical protein
VFNTTYNPECIRTGSRILHQRLKGPSVASYYPPRIGTIAQLRKLYPEMEVMDEQEEDWLEHLNVMKSRGKGAPKKKRTAAGKIYPGWSAILNAILISCRIEEIQQEAVMRVCGGGEWRCLATLGSTVVYHVYHIAFQKVFGKYILSAYRCMNLRKLQCCKT